MLDKTEVRKIATNYAGEVRKVLNPQTIILFGSHVNGVPHENSDVDIAVVVNDYQGDMLQTWKELCRISWNMPGYIEPHLLDELHDQSGFLAHVKKTGEIIYQSA